MLVNLRNDETMNALKIFIDLLVAGVYAVFAYVGHGCSLHGNDYIIPIDAHNPIKPSDCIAIATVSELLQSKLCRVFLIINCCRNQYAILLFCGTITYLYMFFFRLKGPSLCLRLPSENERDNNFENIVTLTAW